MEAHETKPKQCQLPPEAERAANLVRQLPEDVQAALSAMKRAKAVKRGDYVRSPRTLRYEHVA